MKNTILTVCIFLISCIIQAQKPEISYAYPTVFTAGTAIIPLSPVNSGGTVTANSGMVSTIAGNTMSGFVNGTTSIASFYFPTGLAYDKSGNLFVTDKYNHVIRKITPEGVVSTFAGSGSIGFTNGQGTAASFYYPGAVVIDADENLYISDQLNFSIRKITKTGLVSTYAGDGWEESDDGPAATASFRRPEGLALDTAGNLYVAEFWGHKIRKISPSGMVSTLAGSGIQGSVDGSGSNAGFDYPCSIAIDAAGTLYVADQYGCKIRKVTASGFVTTIAGTGVSGSADGAGSVATFNYPSCVLLDGAGNLIVADSKNNKIRKITADGVVSTLSGDETSGSMDGSLETARFNFPFALTFDLKRDLVIADRYNHKIRKMSFYAYSINPALPAGMNFDTKMGTISGIPLTGQSMTTYQVIARNESGLDTTILSFKIQGKPTVITVDVTMLTKTTATCNGNLMNLGVPNPNAFGICWNQTGNPTLADSILQMDTALVAGTFSVTINNLMPNTTYFARAFATNKYGTSYGDVISFTTLWKKPDVAYQIPETLTAGVEISPIKPVNTGGSISRNGYLVSTFAGSGNTAPIDGIGVEAGFNYPMGVAVDSAGYVYVVDRHNNKIRKISPTGKVTTLAGSGVSGSADGVGTNASFNWPYGIDLDAHGNAYVADRYNNIIRKITSNGVVTTIAGSGVQGSTDGVGTAATFNWPTSVALDSSGNIFVADSYNNKIRKISPSGVVTTVAGSGQEGSMDGAALQASFNLATGVEPDNQGNLWIADVNNNMIRKISSSGVVTTVAGTVDRRYSDGVGSAAGFFFPYGLIMDPNGDFLVADANNNRVRKVTKDGVVTTIAGSGAESSMDGAPNVASFNYPADLAYDTIGNIYVADAENHKIRKIAPLYYTIFPSLPSGLNFDAATGVIYGRPLKGSPIKDYYVTTVNASGKDTTSITLSILDTPVVSTQPATNVTSKSALGNGTMINVGFPYPTSYGICWSKTGMPTVDSLKTNLGIATQGGVFTSILNGLQPFTRYIVRSYAVSVLGTTYGDTISFTTPGPAPEIDYSINEQTDTAGVEIKPVKLTIGGGAISPYTLVSTIAGQGNYGFKDGPALNSQFNNPYSVAVAKTGDIYVADIYNYKIRQITPEGIVKTLAGTGLSGSLNGPVASATFSNPNGIAVDLSGNVYVTETNNLKIRKISKDGVVSTFAGSGNYGSTDGIGTAASFCGPIGVAVDTMGTVYVADYNGNKIRKITSAGMVTTLAGSGNYGSADGIGTSASFYGPHSIAVDVSGTLYVTEFDGNKIRKITPDGVVTTLAGNGTSGSIDGIGANATFYSPAGITVDSIGNLYVADRRNQKIRKITPEGVVTTLAGTGVMGSNDGIASVASFNDPSGICLDTRGNLLIADQSSQKIRKISSGKFYVIPELPAGLNLDTETGTISGKPKTGASTVLYSIIASNLGGKDTASLNLTVLGLPTVSTTSVNSVTAMQALVFGNLLNLGSPSSTTYGVCWNKTGMPVVTDSLFKGISPTGPGSFLAELTMLSPGNTYFVRAYATNSYGTSYGEVLSFTTPEQAPRIQYLSPQAFTVGKEVSALVPVNNGGIPLPFGFVSTFSGNGTCVSTDGVTSIASFANPSGIASDSLGNLFVADATSHKIRKISTVGIVSTFAGSGSMGAIDGFGTSASFYTPRGIAVDGQGNVLVADTYNNKIRKIAKDGLVSTLAGSGSVGNANGQGTSASFNFPMGLAVDTSGTVYVADKNNNRICKITATGMVSTLAGSGLQGTVDGTVNDASFNQPSGVAVDAMGNVYVADYGNHKIRKISTTGNVSTLAGNSYYGQSDGTGSSASFYYPIGIAVDKTGTLFVAEYGNSKIRKITSTGVVTTFAGRSGYNGYVDGKSTLAQFMYPYGVAVTNDGLVFVADYGNNRIRKVGSAYYSISPNLPSGLKFNNVTGTISGIPTTVSSLYNYTVTSSNSGGNNNANILISVVNPIVELQTLTNELLSVYPNPATDQISISGLKDREMLTIYSLTGVKLHSQDVTNGELIDISKLKPGLYMVKVGDKELKLVKK